MTRSLKQLDIVGLPPISPIPDAPLKSQYTDIQILLTRDRLTTLTLILASSVARQVHDWQAEQNPSCSFFALDFFASPYDEMTTLQECRETFYSKPLLPQYFPPERACAD